jgi:plastocyanin
MGVVSASTVRRRATAAVVAATSLVVAGCGIVLGTDDDEGAASTEPAAAELRVAAMAFEPTEVTLAAGETLAIVNDDDLAHTVTAASGVFDVAVESGNLVRLTIDEPGTHPFRCELHPSMTGRLVVEP